MSQIKWFCWTRTKAWFWPAAGLPQGLLICCLQVTCSYWLQHRSIAQPAEQREGRWHSNSATSRLIQKKVNALAFLSGNYCCRKHCSSLTSPSLSQHRSTTFGTTRPCPQHQSSTALTYRGIISWLPISLVSSSHRRIAFLWAGLTLLGIAPPQVYVAGGFTETLPILFLLSLLFSAIQPWLRVLTYFLHTQTHGGCSLSPTETMSPFVSCLHPPSRSRSSQCPCSCSTALRKPPGFAHRCTHGGNEEQTHKTSQLSAMQTLINSNCSWQCSHPPVLSSQHRKRAALNVDNPCYSELWALQQLCCVFS